MLECKVYGANDLRVMEVPTPVAGVGEVLIRLGAAGICGSDMHYYFHGRVGSFMIREPLTPGHEASGVVAGIGAGVTRVKIGDRIAVNPSRPCGNCPGCREGRENLCANMKFLGSASVFPHMQGMFSEYFVMPQQQCVPVTSDVSLEEIAMSEPLVGGPALGVSGRQPAWQTCADHRQRNHRLHAGAGLPIGGRLAHHDHRRGRSSVVGRAPSRRRRGRPNRSIAGRYFAGSNDRRAGRCVRSFGRASALASCLETVRRGGVTRSGRHPARRGHAPDGEPDHVARARRTGFVSLGQCIRTGRRAIAERRVDVRPVLSGTHPLSDAAAAITLARDKTRSMKVQLRV